MSQPKSTSSPNLFSTFIHLYVRTTIVNILLFLFRLVITTMTFDGDTEQEDPNEIVIPGAALPEKTFVKMTMQQDVSL